MYCDILKKIELTIETLERLNNISKKPIVSQELIDDQKDNIDVMRDYFDTLEEKIDNLNNCKREEVDKIIENVIKFHFAYLDASEFLESMHKMIDEFIKKYRELNE